jgi:peptide/nickel transport system permease protein
MAGSTPGCVMSEWIQSQGSQEELSPDIRSPGRQVLRYFVRHRMAVVASGGLMIMILAALFASATPYDPRKQEPANTFAPPSEAHWFGTDELGRDVFTRILYGGRISLAVGLSATLLSLLVGIFIGSISGFFGGWLDNVLMRVTDAFLGFPSVFVLILLASLLREQNIPWLRNSILIVIVVIATFSWMWPARLVRGLTLSLREREFVLATRSVGASPSRIIFTDILPNCVGPLIVSGTLEVAYAIITESGLSYLGFGVQPPTPSWGNILNSAQHHVFIAPWLAVFPGLMIFITVICINYIGDGLRDAFDPFTIRAREA